MYWSWNGRKLEGRSAEATKKKGLISGGGSAGGGLNSIFENNQYRKVLNIDAVSVHDNFFEINIIDLKLDLAY